MSDENRFAEIDAEFERIGMSREDTGGLSLGPGSSLDSFRDFLRAIPDGAGYDEFLRRSRKTPDLTDTQLLARADDELFRTLRNLLGWKLQSVTWAERAHYLELIAEQIALTKIPRSELCSVCHFCGTRPKDFALGTGPSGAVICVECAESYAYGLRYSNDEYRKAHPAQEPPKSEKVP